MLINQVLTCGNAPLSAAQLSGPLDEVLVKFRRQLDEMVDSLGASGLRPTAFREFSSALRASSAAAALDVLVAVLQAADGDSPTVEADGRTFRFRGSHRKAAEKTREDGRPIHSFRTLLASLGSIVCNVCRRSGIDQPIKLYTKPSASQREALELLESIGV